MNETKTIDVMIVEDSRTIREFLIGIISADPSFRVVATAPNGKKALEVLAVIPRPAVITMDLNMPLMDGFAATRAVMESHPTPIVVISARPDTREAPLIFKALEAGALAVINLPSGPGTPGHAEAAAEMRKTLRLMSEVKVVRRWQRTAAARGASAREAGLPGAASPPSGQQRALSPAENDAKFAVVAIGASTGGPMAIKSILQGIRKTFPIPILVVQHMASGFMEGFTQWLGEGLDLQVLLAEEGTEPKGGRVYVAPENFHLEVGMDHKLHLTARPPEHGLRPTVSHLFRSVAEHYGASAIAVLLTGMGRDGAAELAQLRKAGALTIAQDEASSIVHGMPGEAIRLGAARFVLPPVEIAAELEKQVRAWESAS